MDCVLNRPTCKRTIMEGKGQLLKENCPVLEKPKCMFATQQCPLLPEENGCTIAKVMDIIQKGGCFANQPPPPPQRQCCCCCCAQPEPEPENTVARCRVNRTIELPPCKKCKRGINAPGKEKPVALSKSPSGKKKKKHTSTEKNKNDQKSYRINKFVPDCTLNSRRPFPCADCLMQLLDCPLRSVDYDNSKVYCKARAVKCPFTQVIDTCDASCLCSNVPAIDTGPKCPFLPEPCPCVAVSCPLSRVPPNPLVERLPPPPCQKPYCRCYCPVIPNPCSFSCPECLVHSGKVKCPLEQGNICPTMLAPTPQICYCVPVDSSKIELEGSAEENHKPAEKGPPNNLKIIVDVNHEVEVEKAQRGSSSQKGIRKDLIKKVATKPGPQITHGKEQESGIVLLNENQESVPSPNQEQYQKTSHRKHPFDQYTQSRSDQFPYFVDTKRGNLRTDFETKSEHASTVETTSALEGIEDYYDGRRDWVNLTTSDLYSTKSTREDVGGCRCWSEYKRRRKLTNYPSIRTESLYKSTESKNDMTKEQTQPRIMNRSKLAKMLPSPSTYVRTNVINKMDAPKLCKAPLGMPNFTCHEPPSKPTTANISEKDKEIAGQFANRISAKIESPEFRFFDEFIMCECISAPQSLIVGSNECPCEETSTVQTCACGVGYKFPQCGCPCGSSCPSKLSSPTAQRTFHVPTCPLSRPLPQPRSPEKDDQVCPFSPNECPLGPYCLFPVAAKYDPKSPTIPKTDKICFCQDQDCLSPPQTFEPPCPLEKINHNKCVCACQPASCPPCCPLAQPESLPPIFRRCPFICPQNNDCTPPPITRLCNWCAKAEDCEPMINEPLTTEGMLCFCENAPPKQKTSNITPPKTSSPIAQNNALSIGKNAQSEQPGKFSDLQNKAIDVAFLPESLTKLLNEGKSEDNGMFSDFNCLCTGGLNGMEYEKANYDIYKSEARPSCKCCPCANKPTIKCPLNLENCPCLNLTQTNACPLNSIQCPVERPICPVKPKITPEIKPNEAPIVKPESIKEPESNLSVNTVRTVNESESDLTKKSGKIEQTVEKKHVTSVGQKVAQLTTTANRPQNQKPKADADKSGPIKLSSKKKHFANSHGQKLVGGTPKCMLEKPKCPLTGIKPAVIAGDENPTANADKTGRNQIGCPIMNSPCELFPEGRCPMMAVGACNCNYPVAPCMAPAQCGYVNAPPQYCYKEDCCMGLTLPPIYPAAHGKYDTGFYYKFMDWKPGEKTTKHYIEVSEEPPPMDFFHGHEFRQHDNWWILREGKGYEQCKKVQEIIDKRGPVGHRGTQFEKKDNPLDIETQTIMENRKNREEKMYSLETARPGWKE
ncbi:uncharacterized protein LOC106662599 [Cimex lectularius]|uniref:Uncharacterized protein n=1 Tax=Cimex lectularius TaxID=79782 RepID=A0A8I6RHQ7_CIMLE|nr:uncharacterized protein LOC106662599 [Cimex lectularius]